MPLRPRLAEITGLIADDQGVVREGLSLMFGLLDDLDVVGTAIDGADAVRQASACGPDVVLMDLKMPTSWTAEAPWWC